MDTVSIRIKGSDKFRVALWARFNPEFSLRTFNELSTKERNRAKDKQPPYVRHFILHPEKTEDLYVPKVEIFENADPAGIVWHEMSVMLSIPKLLYENSLQEVAPGDKEKLFQTLSDRLLGIGVAVSPQTIAKASVSVVHFCKNICLPADISFCAILAELSRVDLGKAYDTTEDTRRVDKNNSEELHLYCGTREWAFYDKLADLKRPKGKGADRQKTSFEKELLDMYDLGNKEVFRYEYRLKKAQTIRSEINRILGREYVTPILFDELFQEGLWKKILVQSWQKVVQRPENQLALLAFDNKLDLLLHLLKNAKVDTSAHSQNKALWSYGLTLAIKDHGVKAIRKEVGKVWPGTANERLDEKLAKAAELARGIPLLEGVLHIDAELAKFERVTLDTLPKVL